MPAGHALFIRRSNLPQPFAFPYLLRLLAFVLQLLYAEQVILLHVTERPGLVFLVFLGRLLHRLLVA